MSTQEQKEVVKKKIEAVNGKIAEIGSLLSSTKVPGRLTIEILLSSLEQIAAQGKKLELIQEDLTDLYEEYAYLLELEVEEKRGENIKRR